MAVGRRDGGVELVGSPARLVLQEVVGQPGVAVPFPGRRLGVEASVGQRLDAPDGDGPEHLRREDPLHVERHHVEPPVVVLVEAHVHGERERHVVDPLEPPVIVRLQAGGHAASLRVDALKIYLSGTRRLVTLNMTTSALTKVSRKR